MPIAESLHTRLLHRRGSIGLGAHRFPFCTRFFFFFFLYLPTSSLSRVCYSLLANARSNPRVYFLLSFKARCRVALLSLLYRARRTKHFLIGFPRRAVVVWPFPSRWLFIYLFPLTTDSSLPSPPPSPSLSLYISRLMRAFCALCGGKIQFFCC